MKNLQAILFCGGRGSRLYPITDFYQKVMMPIGKDGKPLLEYVINHIKSFGVTEFVALVGYRHNLIRRYFGDGIDGSAEFSEHVGNFTIDFCKQNFVLMSNYGHFFHLSVFM